MKPYVIAALSDYPVAVRYYAHELACHRSILRYRDNAPCPDEYARTPDVCRKCALEGLRPLVQSGIVTSWTEEYRAARAFAPGYFQMQEAALRQAACAIVSNPGMAAEAAPYFEKVFVVPGGADVTSFKYSQVPQRAKEDRKIILMTGRGEDPAKGASVLLEAGERLARKRSDFEIHITMPCETPGPDWFRPLGWLSQKRIRQHYEKSDIVVVPSLWEEPFGLVAVEAMASGRPVCASRVGGLQDIVKHWETGMLFDRADSAALAEVLNTLLDDGALRLLLGEAGRRRAEAHYAWPQVLKKYYPPILSYLESRKGSPACA
jgi:glycosyltransferase involved in cell wall biosynthesis